MRLSKKLFGKRNNSKGKKTKIEEQCLKLKFNYGLENLDELYSLRQRLALVIESNNLGEYDGHEIATDLSDGFMFIYGSSAQAIYENIKPILEGTAFLRGGLAVLILGELGSECERQEIEL